MSITNKIKPTIFKMFLLFISFATFAGGPVGADLSINFNSDTIGPGSNSRLTYTFDPIEPSIVSNLGVINNLPAGVTLSTPSNPISNCTNVNISAPDGGATIAISGISLSPTTPCAVSVNVTSNMPAVYLNVTGNVTSSAGTGNSASANLTVAANLPGFSKSFAPSTVGLGAPSTLTFLIDNTLNASNLTNLQFTDTLPAGMIIASPANASTTCIGPTGLTLTAVSGSNQVSLSASGFNFAGFEVLLAGNICTVTVDVVSGTIGELINISSELNSASGGSAVPVGFAVASLDVTAQKVVFTKDFIDDPIAPGGTGALRFTILNTDRNNPTTDMAFTDDLDAILSGLVATGLPQSNVCGFGSSLTGSGLISLTGGNLPAEGSCSFDVTVQVPAGAVPGQYTNTTSTLTGDLDGSPFVSNSAVSQLFVEPSPLLSKEFTNDPVGAGSDVTLEFTVTNTSSTFAATDITFVDNLASILPGGTVVTPALIADACGAGSSVNVVSTNPGVGGQPTFTLTLAGGNLSASASCTFSVDITVPLGQANGVYTNITNAISATVDGQNYTGKPATDDLVVVAAPTLTKEFTDDPVVSGGTVTLEFTLEHGLEAPGDASNITFSDDLNATLMGLSATGLPINDICGLGSSLSGTTNLSFTGGLLAPGESCSFSVTLNVPVGAPSGLHTNTTSIVTANVLGVSANGSPAEDDLNVADISFSKEFLDDPVLPGQSTSLRFTIDNTNNTQNADINFFTDNLAFALTGLAAVGLPTTDTCGGAFSGTTFIVYTGGSVLAGALCIIEVDIQVPLSASSGAYTNTTSDLIVTIGGNAVTLPPAIDTLNVNTDVLLFSKEFLNDPVAPGSDVTLEFTIENIDPVNTVTDINFTDDLDATLSGLVFSNSILNECGGIAVGTGTGLMNYSGGTLMPLSSCTIQVNLTVPAMATSSINPNTTSVLTGMIGTVPVNGNAATDDLLVDLVTFSKSFDGPTTATGTPVLTYTITNLDASNPASNLGFTDNLDSVISGLVATGLLVNDSCGIGSTLSGTSFLTLSGGSIPASGMCEFSVNLSVPASATAGSFPSISSDLTSGGLFVANPASTDLVIEPPPTFNKSFAPNAIGLNQSSTLLLTIDNSASALAANNLDFTDNFPNGIIYNLGSPVNNTCGGSVSATNVFGASTVSLTGGSVSAGSSCTIQVSVAGSLVGSHVNTTGDLSSSSGNSGTASATLVVNPQPGFSKSFATDPIFIGGTSTLTFAIDNSASTVMTTSLNFSDTLPAGLSVANPSNASTTCTGGTLTAVANSSTITYASGAVAMGVLCTVTVDIVGNSSGNWTNVSGDLTSSLGNSGTATDSIVVNGPPTFSKSFSPNVIIPGDVSTLTFTVNNSTSSVNATALDFTDNLPAGVTVAASPIASTNCTGGTITATPGAATISYTGGSVNAGASCEISVDVTSSTIATHMNLTGDLISNHGNSGPAAADLVVTDIPVFSKGFMNNPHILNSPTALVFAINNTAGLTDVGSLGFTDVMPNGFTVANPANISNNCTGGTVTATPGSDTISYSNGTVLTGNSCSLSVDVSASLPGSFTNTTSVLSTELGDGNVATAMIDIIPPPLFNKAFVQSGYTILPGLGQTTPPNPFSIGLNGTSSLVFTIDNTDSTFDANNLNFVDNLPTDLILASPVNEQINCSGGTLTANNGGTSISYSGGSVAAGELCVIVVDVTSSVLGTYNNISESLTSSLGDSGTANHSIIVSDITIVSKSFARSTDIINTANTLTFTFDNSAAPVNNLVSLVDPLPTGMQIASVPNFVTDCEPFFIVSAPPFGTEIGLYETNMLAGATCTASVDIIATASGVLTNVTNPLGSDLGEGNQATAILIVEQPPVFTKQFAPANIGPGEISTLTLSIDNSANTIDSTDLDFTDNLPAGVTLATPANASTTCTGGTLVAVDGTAIVGYTGGTVSAGVSCTVSVDVTSSTLGTATNVTDDLNSSHGNSGSATADLTVTVTDGLAFTKSYDDLVVSGGNVVLSFIITNNNNAQASNINFTDNLSAQIAANAINLPINDACGVGSQMTSTGGIIQLIGGNLSVSESCQIDVLVQIGASVAPGVYTNTTSPLSADFGLATIVSAPASADFTVVSAPTITKVFDDGNITSGETVDLTFSISNNSPVAATQISFSDDLDAFISESTAINLPQNDVCGVGSVLSGTSTIVLQNGVLAANSSCQFTVTVSVPVRTLSGSYTNVTSAVTADYNGNGVTGNANAVATAALYVQAFVYPVPLLTDWKLLTLLIFFMLLMANVMFYRSERR